jgi:uncharacterized protein YacL
LPAINPVLIAVAVVIAAFFVFVIARVVGAHRRQASAWREMGISVLPKTSLGRWSLGLAIASIVVFVVAAGPFREQWGLNENEELVNPVLTVVLTIIIVGTSGADLVTGLISVIKRKERSVLVFLGMLITFWWGLVGAVGEFLI